MKRMASILFVVAVLQVSTAYALVGSCELQAGGSHIKAYYTNIFNQIYNEVLRVLQNNPAHFYRMSVNPSRTKITLTIFNGQNSSNAEVVARRTCGT